MPISINMNMNININIYILGLNNGFTVIRLYVFSGWWWWHGVVMTW